MRLTITEPASRDCRPRRRGVGVRAEDASGSFGILARPCRSADRRCRSRSCPGRACRRQVRLLRGAARCADACTAAMQVAIATREAQRGDDLDALEATGPGAVPSRGGGRAGRAAVAATRLHTQAIRRIVDALRPDRQQRDRARDANEPDGLLRSVRRRRDRHQRLAATGRAVLRRATWRRSACSAGRSSSRLCSASSSAAGSIMRSRHRHLLDRAAAAGRAWGSAAGPPGSGCTAR